VHETLRAKYKRNWLKPHENRKKKGKNAELA